MVAGAFPGSAVPTTFGVLRVIGLSIIKRANALELIKHVETMAMLNFRRFFIFVFLN